MVSGRDSYTLTSFDPDTVSLKWDPEELLNGDCVFSQEASDGGDANTVHVNEHCLARLQVYSAADGRD